MNEVKQPKKPLIFYYTLVMVALVLVNFLLVPWIAEQQIIEVGSTVVKNRRGTIHCLTIIGQVEGHTTLPPNVKTTKYEHVLPLLTSVEEKDDVDGLLLLLNTVGGDIGAGLAIAVLTGNAGHGDIAHLADHTLRSIAELPALLRSI